MGLLVGTLDMVVVYVPYMVRRLLFLGVGWHVARGCLLLSLTCASACIRLTPP